MELRQLKYFVKTAETLNFTEAAKLLFITQSTLSQQIKQLETELQTLLFDRIGKKIYLTEAGTEFLPFAKKTIADSEFGIQRLRDLQNIQTGELRIGVIFTLSDLITSTIIAFSKKYPNIKLVVINKPVSELLDLLKERELDLILSYKPDNEDNQIEYYSLFDSNLSVIVNYRHPLVAQREVSPSLLKQFPLVLPSVGSQARLMIDQILNNHHVRLTPQIEISSMTIMMKLVETGHWIAVMSETLVRGHDNLRAIPIAGKQHQMHPAVIVLKESYQKLSAKEFIRILFENLNPNSEK
ncbi:MAG: LysR family transcriptional regulator [Salinivirgaceae bacterium]|nr:LysR family transcriptional regulator [Salinivirgaceae bacterium]